MFSPDVRTGGAEGAAAGPDAAHLDAGLLSLCGIAGFFRIAADADKLRHELALHGHDAAPDDLVRAARLLGLRARVVSGVTPARLASIPLPAIVQGNDGCFCVLIGRDEAGRCRLADPVTHILRELSSEALFDEIAPLAVLVTRRFAGAGYNPKTFGFRWFLPSIWRYRRPIAHVLVASLFVQLFALITPLFFQVVIDKVLTHRAFATLYVLVAGLVLTGLFDVALQYLRSYALAHTTNRIDVELGRRLFSHLLDLPLAYFETRAAGQTVARLRELESVRQFLTGQALFSGLDLVFAAVFAAVPFAYSPSLTLIVLATLPVYVVIGAVVRPILREVIKDKFDRGAASPAVPRRGGGRHRHREGGRSGADDAGAMGGAPCSLCRHLLLRHPVGGGRAVRHPVHLEADYRIGAVVRRLCCDGRHAQRWRAGGLQHDQRPAGRPRAALVADLARLPAGAGGGGAARRHSQPAGRVGAALVLPAAAAARADRAEARHLPLPAQRGGGAARRVAGDPPWRGDRHCRPVGVG